MEVINCDKLTNESKAQNFTENQYIEELSIAEELDHKSGLDINPCTEASSLICDYKRIKYINTTNATTMKVLSLKANKLLRHQQIVIYRRGRYFYGLIQY